MSFCDPQFLELRKRKFILVGTEQNNNAQFLSNYSLISLKKKSTTIMFYIGIFIKALICIA